MAKLLLSLSVMTGLTLSSSSNVHPAKQADRDTVLRTCMAVFGSPIDAKNGLFEVNRFYVLEAKFEEHGRLAQLGVLPKHWFADDHPEWEEADDVGELSEIEYESLLGRLDSVRPKGRLVERAKMSVVTNCTARIRDRYEGAVLETGDVVDARRPEDAPRAIKYFIVYFTAMGPAK